MSTGPQHNAWYSSITPRAEALVIRLLSFLFQLSISVDKTRYLATVKLEVLNRHDFERTLILICNRSRLSRS